MRYDCYSIQIFTNHINIYTSRSVGSWPEAVLKGKMILIKGQRTKLLRYQISDSMRKEKENENISYSYSRAHRRLCHVWSVDNYQESISQHSVNPRKKRNFLETKCPPSGELILRGQRKGTFVSSHRCPSSHLSCQKEKSSSTRNVSPNQERRGSCYWQQHEPKQRKDDFPERLFLGCVPGSSSFLNKKSFITYLAGPLASFIVELPGSHHHWLVNHLPGFLLREFFILLLWWWGPGWRDLTLRQRWFGRSKLICQLRKNCQVISKVLGTTPLEFFPFL